MKIILEDQRLAAYSRTNDAVEAFAGAVNNGQARLALEILVPVIQSIYSFMSSLDVSDDPIVDSKMDTGDSNEKNDKKAPVKKAVGKKDIVNQEDEELNS